MLRVPKEFHIPLNFSTKKNCLAFLKAGKVGQRCDPGCSVFNLSTKHLEEKY
jgi:hypothetical protein